MITALTGLPGSGKSLDSARRIKYALRGKRHVVSNFDFNVESCKHPEHFHFVPNSELTVEFLVKLSRELGVKKESQILLVVDECTLLWNCREWNAKGRDEWISFFAQHRKLGYDVLLIMQDLKTIDKQIKGLVEIETMHRNLLQFGMLGWILKQLLHNHAVVLCISYWVPLCGHGKCKAAIAERGVVIGSKRLYSLYDTFNNFGR